MRHFRITFFRLKTSFLERDMNEKFRKKFLMFLYIASINGIHFKLFIDFSMNEKIITKLLEFQTSNLEYLAHTNWSKKSASGFLFFESITTRIGWSRFCDRPLFFFCNTALWVTKCLGIRCWVSDAKSVMQSHAKQTQRKFIENRVSGIHFMHRFRLSIYRLVLFPIPRADK